MEGDRCYKYSTVARYVDAVGLPPILNAVDIGAYMGDTVLEMVRFFPKARIDAYEGIGNFADRARDIVVAMEAKGKIRKGGVRVFNEAVTNDAGRQVAHMCPDRKKWSIVVPEGCEPLNLANSNMTFVTLAQEVATVNLATVVGRMGGVDFLKIDCEGCESVVLGGCELEVLRGIRFVGGEYHGLRMFWDKTRNTLWKTHRVQIMGKDLSGTFFAARLGLEADILDDSLQRYVKIPGLFFHPFKIDHVLDGNEAWHGLPKRCQHAEWARRNLIRTMVLEMGK